MLCAYCKVDKDQQEFYKCSKSKCKECYKKKQVEYYAKTKKEPVKRVLKPVAAFEALPQETQGQILIDAKIGANGKPMSKLQISKKYNLNYKYVCDWYVLGIVPP